MSKFSSADSEKLLELLGREFKIYGQIQELTEKQTQLLATDDIDGLDSLLDERAELIEKIKGLHQDSEPLMQSYVSSSGGGSGSNGEINSLKSEIRKKLEICNELNEENVAVMREKTQEHTKKIDEQSAKRKGIGGYAQAVPNTPEMFDKKS